MSSYPRALFAGSAGGTYLNKPVVGIAPSLDGGGYWLTASEGGVFTYGVATYAGSQGGSPLNAPIVGGGPGGPVPAAPDRRRPTPADAGAHPHRRR